MKINLITQKKSCLSGKHRVWSKTNGDWRRTNSDFASWILNEGWVDFRTCWFQQRPLGFLRRTDCVSKRWNLNLQFCNVWPSSYGVSCFLKQEYPQIIHSNGIFPYRPSIPGYHHLWKPAYVLFWPSCHYQSPWYDWDPGHCRMAIWWPWYPKRKNEGWELAKR